MSVNKGFKEFAFDAGDEHVGNKSMRWKGTAGNTYRFSFISWPGLEKGTPDFEAPSPKFLGASTNYIQGAGFVVNNGPEFTKLAGDRPRSRIGTVIVEWPMDKRGNIDNARIISGDIDVLVWVFSGDKYKTLKMLSKEFPFGTHDIKVEVTDTNYQKMTITPCQESLLRKLMENPKGKEVVAGLLAKAQDLASNLSNEIGVEMTIEQVRAKMSGLPASGNRAAVGTPDAATTGDVDGLLDNLLGG